MDASSASLKEYLRKHYETNDKQDEKKKKKKRNVKPVATGVSVVDEDPVWQKPVKFEEEENNDSPDEEPQVDEDIEVKRVKRLEQLRAKQSINPIAEDGSGWVSLSPKRADSFATSSDMSPPRQNRTRNDTPSPERERSRENMHRHFSSDISPPRKKRSEDDSPTAQPGLYHSVEDKDFSPPRKRHQHHDNHPLDNTRRTIPSSSTVSCDLSPPRKQRARYDTPSPEPVLKDSREGADLSPPRKSRKVVVTPRSGVPTRSSANDNSLNDDLSPPRKKRAGASDSVDAKEQPVTGLVSGHDISKEILRKKRNDMQRFEEMAADVSGKGAEPIYRGKKGERISKEEYLKSKEKKVEKPKEKKIEWGKGLAQKREVEAKVRELEAEKEKPFARTRDDPELDTMLKERLRWGDPMAHLVKKRGSEHVVSDLGDDEKMKESGFIIPQEIPSHSWIKRGLPPAANRYGIKPGRHWDGVDRSNGYEKQFFKRANEKQATEREAYLWSVSDM
ncbi:BUD13 homolog [Linum grandiflorum]